MLLQGGPPGAGGFPFGGLGGGLGGPTLGGMDVGQVLQNPGLMNMVSALQCVWGGGYGVAGRCACWIFPFRGIGGGLGGPTLGRFNVGQLRYYKIQGLFMNM